MKPPLLYTLAVIASKKWDNLTFLTSVHDDKLLNPTFRVIEELLSQGMLGTNGTIVETHKVGGCGRPRCESSGRSYFQTRLEMEMSELRVAASFALLPKRTTDSLGATPTQAQDIYCFHSAEARALLRTQQG